MLQIRNIVLRCACVLFAVGLSFVLAEFPRIDGGLTLSVAVFIAMISSVSSLGLCLTTLAYQLKYRRLIKLTLIPSVIFMPMLAHYYSPYLLGPTLVVLAVAFYNISSARETVQDALLLGFKVDVVMEGCRAVNIQDGDDLRAFDFMRGEGARLVHLKDALNSKY